MASRSPPRIVTGGFGPARPGEIEGRGRRATKGHLKIDNDARDERRTPANVAAATTRMGAPRRASSSPAVSLRAVYCCMLPAGPPGSRTPLPCIYSIDFHCSSRRIVVGVPLPFSILPFSSSPCRTSLLNSVASGRSVGKGGRRIEGPSSAVIFVPSFCLV